MKTFKLDELLAPGAVITEFVKQIESVPALKSVEACIIITRDIIKRLCMTTLKAGIDADVRDMYDNHVMAYGEYPDYEIGQPPAEMTTKEERDQWLRAQHSMRMHARENWVEPIEKNVEDYFDEYAKLLGASWIGTVDNLTPRKATDIEKLVNSFAEEAWRNLIAYFDKEDEMVKEKSASQVLSAVGIVRADIEAILASRPEVTQPKEETMAPLNYDFKNFIHELHEFADMVGLNGKSLEDIVDSASDSNDVLANSGMTALGAGDDPAKLAVMRDLRKRYGTEHLAVMIENDTYAAVQEAPPVDEAAELAAMTGGVGPVPTAVTFAEAPAPVKPRGKQAADYQTPAPTDSGTIPASVLSAIKNYTNVKSETVGEALGVSRATFDNYAKGKGAKLHATHANRAYLTKLLDDHIGALMGARSELD